MTMATARMQLQRDRWRYTGLLVAAVALLVALGVQVILLIPTTYTATSAIALRPLTAEQSADTIEMQAHEFAVALGAKESAAAVLESLDASASGSDVAVTAIRDSGTSTVRVEVSSTDREIAVAVANGLAAEAEQLGEGDATAEVVVVVEAGTAGVTSDPPRNLYIAALVALAGLLLAGGLYQIRERTS